MHLTNFLAEFLQIRSNKNRIIYLIYFIRADRQRMVLVVHSILHQNDNSIRSGSLKDPSF